MISLHKLLEGDVDFLVDDPFRVEYLKRDLLRLADGIKCFDCGDGEELESVKLELREINCIRLPYEKNWFEFSTGKTDRHPERIFRFGVAAERKETGNWFHCFMLSALSGWQAVGLFRFDHADNFNFNSLVHADFFTLAQDQCARCVTAVAKFLKMLSCKNVDHIEMKPDAQLQKARIKRGKLPLFSAWVCVLKGKSKSGEWLGGTHASPRLHYRRGHVRNLAKGPIWVRECMVGNKELGLVEKTYRRHEKFVPSAGAGI